MEHSGYLFAATAEGEQQRLAMQAGWWDPITFEQLTATGVGAGWRCLEVGAGTGSVAEWLGRQVGARGHVVATDTETRFLEHLSTPNLEVRHHDVVADPIEESAYDLIHARLVLMHLPGRVPAVARLTAALRPGGWLVLEDYDMVTFGHCHPADPTWTAVTAACAKAIDGAGGDRAFGIALAATLLGTGLTGVETQGTVLFKRGPELAAMGMRTLEQLRKPVLGAGAVSSDQFDYAVGLMNGSAPSRLFALPTLVSARGRSQG